jgi:hypothetical protein
MKTALVTTDLLERSPCARFASNCARTLVFSSRLVMRYGPRCGSIVLSGKPSHVRGFCFFGTAAVTMRSFVMALIVKDYVHQELAEDDLQGIYDFIAEAELVAGPDELYTIVSELWPELLHKVKPPRALMH